MFTICKSINNRFFKTFIYLMVNFICVFFLFSCASLSAEDDSQSGVIISQKIPIGAIDDFAAYYTKIDSGLPFEKYSRTGPFTDIVVNVKPNHQLVFWRGSSYLPYWETPEGRWYVDEMVPRRGDGTQKMPDRVNAMSYVRIIENADKEIVVHWRYAPKFDISAFPVHHTELNFASFVDEYFTITPDGRVTRIIKEGTKKVDDWNDPKNKTVQTFNLTTNGITEKKTQNPSHSGISEPLRGNPQKGPAVIEPVACWKFDEAVGDEAKESIGGYRSDIIGLKSLWKKGISGTCLQFDGYNTVVSLPVEKAPRLDSGLTVEGWIAIGAYPWNWAPVVQQGVQKNGYILGVTAYGQAGLRVKIGDDWQEVVSEERMERFKWYHLAGTFDPNKRQITIYINGLPRGSKQVGRDKVVSSDQQVQIGKGHPMEIVDPVWDKKEITEYGFDGLIDEVRIYSKALDAEQIKKSFEAFNPGLSVMNNPDMQKRKLPSPERADNFGARYLTLKYYETWDNLWRLSEHADIVVDFDMLPVRYIFWHGVGYIPMIVSENEQWYSNEFNETWNRSGGRGCQEPMSDKECFHNHVRIIENSPARVVVHWRYPLIDVSHIYADYVPQTGWSEWSDWYYYIYPDGVAVKKMRCWTAGGSHEWQESMAIMSPDQRPEDVFETEPTLIFSDLEGNQRRYNWTEGPPSGVNYDDVKIHVVNYKADYDPFTIGDFQAGNIYSQRTDYSKFPAWNHWPVARVISDGRNCIFPDRASHSSVTHVYWDAHKIQKGDAPFEEKILMEGMAKATAAELVPLARSWFNPAELLIKHGCVGGKYDPAQRAYLLTAEDDVLKVEIKASEQRPLVNPCFVIYNWNTDKLGVVKVNGHMAGKNCRQGIIRDTEGRRMLVVWVQMESEELVEFSITGAHPIEFSLLPSQAEWEITPQVDEKSLSITMKAKPIENCGQVEYYFECVDGDGHNSDWQKRTTYADTGLTPDTKYTYRVKARNNYFFEIRWSDEKSASTGRAPSPVAHWGMDEINGTDLQYSHTAIEHKDVQETAGVVGSALGFAGESWLLISAVEDLHSDKTFTWTAWIRTNHGGTILARAGSGREWKAGGKVLFVQDGFLKFDVGWVGQITSERKVDDGNWHHVAVTVNDRDIKLFIDGRTAEVGNMDVGRNEESGLLVKIGYCNDDFPQPSGFIGQIDDVRWYDYALSPNNIQKLYHSYPTYQSRQAESGLVAWQIIFVFKKISSSQMLM